MPFLQTPVKNTLNKQDIIQLARVELGQVSQNANQLDAQYLTRYESIKLIQLSLETWSFARRQSILTEVPTEVKEKTVINFPFAYYLPADVLMRISILGKNGTGFSFSPNSMPFGSYNYASGLVYQQYGNMLATNMQPSCYLDYISVVEQDEFPPYFGVVIAYALAKTIAYAITNDMQIIGMMEQNYMLALNNARALDGIGNSQKYFRSQLMAVRY